MPSVQTISSTAVPPLAPWVEASVPYLADLSVKPVTYNPPLGTDAGKFLDSVIPLGRHAKAEEVAETVLFLASDKSAFTTGSVVMADGGMHV